jgi:cell division protein FtsB
MPRPQMPRLRARPSSQSLVRWGTRALLAMLIVLSGVLLVNFVRMTWIEHQINQASQRQLAINEAQRQRNVQLEGEAAFRESDVYAEQAAREQLGMAREGETVLLPTVVLPAPTPAPADESPELAPTPAPATIDPDHLPNYQLWWRALFPGADARP